MQQWDVIIQRRSRRKGPSELLHRGTLACTQLQDSPWISAIGAHLWPSMYISQNPDYNNSLQLVFEAISLHESKQKKQALVRIILGWLWINKMGDILVTKCPSGCLDSWWKTKSSSLSVKQKLRRQKLNIWRGLLRPFEQQVGHRHPPPQ